MNAIVLRIVSATAAVGVLALGPVCRAQTCVPHWSDDYWASAPPGEGRALTVFDHGSGPVLYVGTAGSSNAIASWDGERLRQLGSVTGTMPLSYFSTGVYGMVVFDDGTGPALHVGGSFTAVNGVPASGVAKWTGSAWVALGAGVDRSVRAVAAFDDGTGPALYVGGQFLNAGGAAASYIAKWDGRAWSALGAGVSGSGVVSGAGSTPGVFALTGFDDGTGPALYAGGTFDHAGGSPALTIARWKESAWEPVGNGLAWQGGQGLILTLAVLDTGAGPALYAGGRISFGTFSNNNPQAARWTGTSWTPVGTWLPGYYITSFTVGEDAGVRSILAGIYPYSTGQGTVFRLDEQAWTPIGEANGAPVRALATTDEGGVSREYATGNFATLNGQSLTPQLARWNAPGWSTLPGGGSVQSVYRLRTLDLGSGPMLYQLGTTNIGGVTMPGVGRFDGSTWSPVGAAAPGYSPSDVEVFDDGAGTALYVVAAGGVYRLHGNAWQPVGPNTSPFGSNSVFRLKAFDDGAGPRLYAAGSFPGGLAAWDGVAWTSPLGLYYYSSGEGGRAFEVFDDGAGARLYFALDSGLRRWTVATWESLQGPYTAFITDLAVHDDGTGPALFAARTEASGTVVRYDGVSWTVVMASGNSGYASRLASFDDAGGPALFATGSFSLPSGSPGGGLAMWRAGRWTGFPPGLAGTAYTISAYHLPEPSLWIGGAFSSAGGVSASNITRYIGCPPACYADCDESGTLSVADFGCFQTRYAGGDAYADCNASGALTVADFGCFQSRYALGCP